MNSLKSILVALTLTAVSISLAHASPRGDANATRVASGSTGDITRPAVVGSPRGDASQIRVVSGSESSDTLAAIRNSKLSPRAQAQSGSAEFQVAALASKCCTAPCCKK